MKKLMLLFAVIFCIGLVSAIQTLGTFQQGECIDLQQNCANCTYVNFTKVTNPSSEVILEGAYAQKVDTDYNYTSCVISQELGQHIVNWKADPNGITDSGSFDYYVTPSGNRENNSTIVFFVFIVVFMYAISLVGFFGKNEVVTILGGLALLFLGVYIINNGFIIFRDDLTLYMAYVTISWGAISTFWALLSLMDVL